MFCNAAVMAALSRDWGMQRHTPQKWMSRIPHDPRSHGCESYQTWRIGLHTPEHTCMEGHMMAVKLHNESRYEKARATAHIEAIYISLF